MHTHCTSSTSSASVFPAPASHSNWNGARAQERRNLGQWLHLDLWTISYLQSSFMPVSASTCQCHRAKQQELSRSSLALQAPEQAAPLLISSTLKPWRY